MTMTTPSGGNDDGGPKLTKRQRRAQGSNPSTTWQQQPRIKSAGARARAYISYAGLADVADVDNDNDDGKQKKKKKKKVSSSSGGSGDAGKTKSSAIIDPQLDLHSPEVKFGRLLGGTDQRSRHAAVRMLREYLRARSDIATGPGLSELDLLKLWKGLWYTLYMADKAPVQDKLSKILAELMWCLSGTEEEDEYAGQVYLRMEEGGEGGGVFEDEDGDTMEIVEMDDDDDVDNDCEVQTDEEGDDDEEEEDEEQERGRDMNETHCRGAHLVSLYISTFLCTVRREWGNVDKHRVDKFYTAVRYMVREAYKYMAKRHWNLGIIRLFNDVLYSEGLSTDTPGLTNGLRYHLVDICLDELAGVNAEAELPLTEATFLDAMEPFFGLAQQAGDKNVQKRIMDKVLIKFLDDYSFVSETAMGEDENDGEEGEKSLVFNQVHVGTVAKFIFEVASDPDTDERYRRSLYELHKTYMRRIRAAGRDVDLDHFMEEEEEDDGGEEAEAIGAGGDDDDEAAEEEAPENEDANAISKTKKGGDETPAPTIAEAEGSADATSAVEKVESGKKKKRKKKKSKSSDKESIPEAPAETPTPTKEEKSNSTKPSSKKSKGTGGDDDAAETPKATEAAPADKVESSSAVTTPEAKSSSSSKKKRKKRAEKSAVENEPADLLPADVKTPTPKSKRNKKEQSPPSVDPRSMHSPDGGADDDDDDDCYDAAAMSASKRVSFGKMNHCKSHKASMKAMKALEKERWDTANRTPDKGILQTKLGMDSAEKMPGKKKKKKSSEKKKMKKKGGSSGKPPLPPSSTAGKKKGKKNV